MILGPLNAYIILNSPLLYSEAYKIDCATVINSVLPSSVDSELESDFTNSTKPRAAKKQY
jgi:hypothetical protein